MNLVSAGNSETACLQAVREKGYKVSSVIEESENPTVHFTAKKDNNSFCADTGIELLGLIALWEHYGDNWQQGLDKKTWEQLG